MSLVSIYTLSGLGVLSNLIGPLSRTIQYSPPNKWIISEVGVFPIFFLENDLSKVHKILGSMFFKANGMSPVEEAILWTQRFLARKIFPKIEVYLRETKLKENVCRNSTFQVNRIKNTTGKRRLTLSNRAAMSAVRSCEGNDWNLWRFHLRIAMSENCGKIYNNFCARTIITATWNVLTHDLIRQSNRTF